MKFLGTIIALVFLIQNINSQSFELNGVDTINKIDVNRKRQGYWMIKAKAPKLRGYPAGNLIEEGTYKNSRKFDLWKKYFPSAKLRSEITYKGSRPFGKYTLYYENGNVEEGGNWERTKNTGDFKRYHENGEVAQQFTFTPGGKRTGKQTYFYPNGKVRLEGTWSEGLESGEMKEYFDNGDLMAVKFFNNGEMDPAKFESYAPKTAHKDAVKEMINEGKDIKVTASKGDAPNRGGFDGNGYKKLYNRNKQITKDGVFKAYRLMDGKHYKYDENGLMISIMIFKGGRFVGNGVIEKDM
ncbi:MAG: hypothetical protein JKY48_17900 [Flavobacteriales bacterium]|nr:hypothetical protein [Flavobacteriales bacterium]